MNGFIYLDNAATSWPKAPGVKEAVVRAIEEQSANPGRGNHQMAVTASRVLFDARKKLAKLFQIRNPNDIHFTLNTTMGLNMAIKGLLKPGDHVVCTSVEHNSVRRPLEYLKRTIGLELTYVETDEQGRLDVAKVARSIKSNTKLVVATHSSNLLGSIVPIEEIGAITRKRGVYFLVDAAQSAGSVAIDVEKMGIDLLAFPGHKGLLGPQGTGGLYIHPEVDLEPLIHGGTGSQSEAVDQPQVRPDRYESGTPNTPGIAGLAVGVEYVLERGVADIHRHERELAVRMMEGLRGLSGIRLLGPDAGEDRTGIVSFASERIDSSELAFILDQSFGIAVRSGYHCTPLAHETAGTSKTGAVRASVGPFSTKEDADALVAAVTEIVKHYSV
ncbi:aminotransferase class V-fold PLP-dependent enzyme [Paenibacillus thermoaerophilus]|uniref:cysteine desulfurase n=1 Tax=Paenibacillus thermoaerophilus TaxID=1215385 RepID=A0ABW2V2A0_9BACL|nr:aminotransferase class V-fold PLP-dependent enzyme [Paenibacillus thermoaerophilus]TMV06687.1 aminotransferase class V-fold PLP-dependent enzyme [Paenibacillus thermoaerophilus]